MENLFVPASASKIISRIGQLQPAARPLWGKMNVTQMMAHCQVPMEVALGDSRFTIDD